MRLRNSRSLCVDVGWGNSLTAQTLSSSGQIPWALSRCPKKFNSETPRMHLLGLITIPWSLSRCSTWRRCTLCYSRAIRRSSIYAKRNVSPLVDKPLECLGVTQKAFRRPQIVQMAWSQQFSVCQTARPGYDDMHG